LVDPAAGRPHGAGRKPSSPPREPSPEKAPRIVRAEPPPEPMAPDPLKLAPASDGNHHNAGAS
jgi:hypothetical protein